MKLRVLVILLLLSFGATSFALPPDLSYGGQRFGASESIITNGVSRMVILENAVDEDYSLKFISGDGSKNVTVLRLKGTDALSQIQLAYFFFQSTFMLWGMTVE